MKYRNLGFAFSMIPMIVLFQNCAPGFFVDNEALSTNSTASAASVVCGSTLEETFSKTYWPIVTSNCAACHVTGGLAPSAFAASQLSAAFSGFQTATPSKILANGTNPLHGGGAGGEKNRTALTRAQSDFDSCKTTPNVVAGAITARTTAVTLAATATSKIITINLDSQLDLGSANFGGAQLQFVIRTSTVGSTPAYLISNPSLRTVSSTVQVKGMKIKINGATDSTWTSFTQIDRTINAGAQPMTGQTLNGNLAIGVGTFVVPVIQATDTLQFEFETLKVP
jgi:hypothetical protein